MRIGRELVGASAVPVVLGILEEGESYGYAILKRVLELSGGRLEWTEGMLYPLMHRLEQQGYVVAAWRSVPGGRRRKVYRLTDAGREAREDHGRQWEVVDRLVRAVAGGHGSSRQAGQGHGLDTALDAEPSKRFTETAFMRNRLHKEVLPLSATPTMADVAEAAGVSKATVSRVLSGATVVAPATRARILTAVEELGYRPNELAQSFSLGRLSVISVVIPFATQPSAAEVVRGILDEVHSVPYPVTLLDVGTRADRDAHIALLHSTRRPTGAIVGLGLTADEQATLIDAGVPAVLIDHDSPLISSVRVDNEAAGTIAARDLLTLGHTHFGFIGDEANPTLGFVSSAERLAAFRSTLQAELGARARVEVALAPHGRAEAKALALEMLAPADRPTAVFAASDTQALGVLDAARSLGLSVPDDVSVLGCDNVALSEDLGLSTIHVGLRELGRAAGDLLLRAMTNQSARPRRVVIEVSARLRATTASPPRR